MKKLKYFKIKTVAAAVLLFINGCRLNSLYKSETEYTPSETHAVDMRHKDIKRIYDVKKSWISGSKESIDIEMWNMWKYDSGIMGDLYEELENACRRGVRVRIALGIDNKDNEHVDEYFFDCPGIEVLNVDPAAHSKYMIVDGDKVTAGSANWSWSSMEQNYEFNLNVENETIAGAFTYLFESLWEASGQSVESIAEYGKTDNLTPLAHGRYVPDEFKPVHEYQIDKISGARDKIFISIYHYHPFFNQVKNNLQERLADAARRGVKVKLLVDKASYSRTDKSLIDNLASLENTYVKVIDMSPAPYVDGSGTNHTKIFLVDGQYGVISSMNWDRFTFDNSGRDSGLGFKDKNLYKIIEESFYLTWKSPYADWAETQQPLPETVVNPPVLEDIVVENITETTAVLRSELADTGGSDNAGVYFLWQEIPVRNRWEYHFPIFKFSEAGKFNHKIKNLNPDTRYGVVAQGINEAGYLRTGVKYFKTESSGN